MSDRDKKAIHSLRNQLIPTDLLRDLWGIVPERTLPLSKDGINNVTIDKNMTIGELIQGLSILAQTKAEQRLGLPPEDAYSILKDAIESELMRIGKRNDKKSIEKTALLMNVYVNTTQLLADNKDMDIMEKFNLLYKEVEPILKINTGFNLTTANSYLNIQNIAQEIGLKISNNSREFKSRLLENTAKKAPNVSPENIDAGSSKKMND